MARLLFYKPRVLPPQELPFEDRDIDNNLWTNLLNNPEGRMACNWIEAPEKPLIDPTLQYCIWDMNNNNWIIQDRQIVQTPIEQNEPGTNEPTIDPDSLKPTPPQFFLLFTAPERVALRKLAETNPVIADWLTILNDPRLTFVDLSQDSTRQGVGYLGALDVPEGVQMFLPREKVLTNQRIAEILSGKQA